MQRSANDSNHKPLGNIITFYSYKGGTGRSMAVANVAWILASSGRRVLAVDWDLEAPGLHRYFAPFLGDKDLTNSDGLIDLLIEFRDATATFDARSRDDHEWHKSYADILAYAVSLEWEFPRGGTLDLLPAGRQGSSYSARVNSFDWEEFYERRGGGVFLEAVKEKMRADYDYILIDSRTGVSDTSGICTVQMPDAVVVCFTLNNQGIEGTAAVAHSIYEQRLRKGQEIAIFPVPMRVEPFEKTKLDSRRDYAKRMFKLFPSHLSEQARAQFQEDVQVRYLPYYAYEEILATFGNRPGESISLLAPAEKLTEYLTGFLPGEPISRLEVSEYFESRRQAVLAQFEGKQLEASPTRLLIQSAEAAWAGFNPREEEAARRALLRLVRAPAEGENIAETRLLVKLSEFDEPDQSILRQLTNTPIVSLERDPASGEGAAQLSSDELLRNWPRLKRWIADDREFLLWRQKLNLNIAEWRSLGQDTGALLIGAPLELAKQWKSEREADLSQNEIAYINRSIHEDEQRNLEQIRRREEEKRQAAERKELHNQTVVLTEVSQKLQQRGRQRTVIAAGAALIFLAVAVWGFIKFSQQGAREAANRAISEGNEAAKNNLDGAIEKYTEAVNLAPSYENAYYERGRAYLEKKQLDEALADFNQAIKLNENYAEAYVGRGNVRLEKRNYDLALADYSRAIELDPKPAATYVNRGIVYAARDQPDAALADYNRAIELNPNEAEAYLNRGNIYLGQGQHDLALGDYNQAIRLNPDLSEAYVKRGHAYLNRAEPGDYEQAIAAYDQAIKQVTYDPKIYLNRGLAYKNIGQRERAITDYQRALDLNQGERADPQVSENARLGLGELNVAPQSVQAPPTLANPKIYLHYQDAKDLATLNQIAKALDAQPNYKVADKPDQVTQPTMGDVRYFYAEDEKNAGQIKQIVERTLKNNRIEKTIELRFLERLASRVPKGWIEVWLPPLPPPLAPPGARGRTAPNAPANIPNKLPYNLEQKQEQKQPPQRKSKSEY